MTYHDTAISGVKFFRLEAGIIVMVFNTSASYFRKNLFHYFKDYSNDQTDPRVKYAS
jgi:hypothetical protein